MDDQEEEKQTSFRVLELRKKLLHFREAKTMDDNLLNE